MQAIDNNLNKPLTLLLKSSVIVFLGLILSKIFTYVYRIIIAKQFGPEVYGLYSISIMLASWFIVFSTIGLGQGLLRYIPIFRENKEDEKASNVFRKIIFITLTISIIGGGVLFFLSDYLALNVFRDPDLIPFLRIFSFSVPFGVLFNILVSSLRAYEEIGWQSFISNILGTGINVLIIVSLILLGLGSLSVPLSYLIGIIITSVVAIFTLKVKAPVLIKSSPKRYNGLFNEILSYSWPLLFALIIWKIFYWTDTFLIGYFRTIEEVGFYNAALPIAALLEVSSLIFMQLFFPLVNREYNSGEKRTVKELSKQVGKWIFAINLPLLILIISFPEAFIIALFGNRFLPASGALRFLTIGVFFISLFDISRNIISIKGKSKLIMLDIIGVSIVNVILNLILIPVYGITGAGISTAISLMLIGTLFAIQSHHHMGVIPFRRKMLNISLAGLISLLFLFFTKPYFNESSISIGILIILFIFTYGSLLVLLNALDNNDKILLRKIIERLKKR